MRKSLSVTVSANASASTNCNAVSRSNSSIDSESPGYPGRGFLRLAFLWFTTSVVLAATPSPAAAPAPAQVFGFPTANRALLDPAKQDAFFVGTAGKTWVSGTYGCVRSEGWQLHEGLDIRCLERDRRGEPTDKVLCSADGTVAYISRNAALSNYGKYVVVRHAVEGLEVFTLYAHLAEVRGDLVPGSPLRAGEQLGLMGRTSNTHQRITKDRAHVHFEVDLLVNDRYAQWHKTSQAGERNDHGNWNGHNLLGADPAMVLREQARLGPSFSLLRVIQNQNELCRVFVRARGFPWIRRYARLVVPNPKIEKEGLAGYEISLNFSGLPYKLIPRTPAEAPPGGTFVLLSVNEAEQKANPCRRIVTHKGSQWELGPRGRELLELLVYH